MLTAYSLTVLQHQVKAGTLADLKNKRDTVLTHLSTGTWVTVRACNFGQNDAAMYALYAFFGGNADIYAPRLYQWFGDLPVMHGMRLPSRAAVHNHLVRQRFLPKDIHTPDRQDAIVRALTDPASFAEPFELATESLTGAQSPDYSDLISSLTAGQVSALLRSKMHDHGLDLTHPTVTVVWPHTTPPVPPDTWIVHDTLTDAASQEKFAVEYTISESVSAIDDSRTLTAQARLPDATSAQETIILQLLLDEPTDQAYKGLTLRLASTRDDDAPDADNKTAFDALKQLLDGNGASGQTFSAGSVDLRARFEDADAKLADQATITLNTPGKTTPDGLPNSVWTVGPDTDGGSYLIKLEHPYQLIWGEKMRGVSSVRAHTLNVYRKLDSKQLLAMQDALVSHAGFDLDSPGTELAASMDRLGRDELIDLITFLRSPYKPRNVVALHHATQAIKRKGDYGTVRWTGPTGTLNSQKRWEDARTLLNDNTIATSDRVAGLLLLLYAQQLSAITTLTPEHVTTSADEQVTIRLGASPTTLPEPLADLVLELVATRRPHTVIGQRGQSPWLFPDQRPGEHISAERLGERLHALGIRPSQSRSTALFALANELPAAILARMLGINIKAAVVWQHAASGDWAACSRGRISRSEQRYRRKRKHRLVPFPR